VEPHPKSKSYEVVWNAHALLDLEAKLVNKSSSKRYSRFGYIRKLSNNKFQAQYTHQGKTYYSRGIFATKTEAQNWLTLEQSLMLQGIWTDPKKPTFKNSEFPLFGGYAMQHIELQNNSNGAGLKPSTKAKYVSLLQGPLKQFLPEKLDAIHKHDIDKWWADIRNSGKLTSGSKAYKLIHSVMRRAVSDGIIQANPCQIKGAQNASSRVPKDTPTLKEVCLIAENINPRFRELVYVCGYGGFRFGEVTALQRKHFTRVTSEDKAFYVVSVERAVAYVNGEFILGTPKSEAGIDDVYLKADLTPMLDAYLGAMKDSSPEELVFPAANGSFLRNDVFAKAIKASLKRLGISKRYTPHSFRRAGATEIQNKGGNISEVQDFLRDASPVAALSYVQTTNRKRALVELMQTPLAVGEQDLNA
jgi:integrase